MAVALLFDVHVDGAIANQLRLRQVDVLTAQSAGAEFLSDEQLLELATKLSRPLVTHDIRFHAMAQQWQAQGRSFGGLIFGHALQISIGQCVKDLEIIAKATEPADWTNAVLRLPL